MPDKLLATAQPNPDYIYARCLKNIRIEARQSGSRTMFYEVDTDTRKEHCIPRDTVLYLFTASKLNKYRPFTIKGNRKFSQLLKLKSS
jgi:hypothetical protein